MCIIISYIGICLWTKVLGNCLQKCWGTVFKSVGELSSNVLGNCLQKVCRGTVLSGNCLIPCKSPWYCLPSFRPVGLSVQEKFNIDFQDACYSHLGFPIGTISAIFDLQIARYFLPSWHFSSGEEAQNRFFKMAQWWPSWISNQNNCIYFLSTSCPHTFYHVSSQLAFQVRTRSAK